MKFLKKQIQQKYYFWILLALAIPALFIHLGTLVFLEDESIRALVALEMDLSGNFIAPTLNSTFYHAKPPLYNWILWLSFEIFGGASEWTARVPTIFFLAIYGTLIYYFTKSSLGNKYALLNAFSFITCGRVLFWESMLGLIDMAYSVVCFSMFMLLYHFFKKEQYGKLFLSAYILSAIGFLMKGFPSLLFLGISLLVLFLAWKRPKKLFSLSHLWGIIAFALIVGGYYSLYQYYQDPHHTLMPLLDQATRRTPMAFDFKVVIQHIFAFPFEILYHFFPWTLLCILLIAKGRLTKLFKQDFLRYCLYIFFFNIIVYWISPQVYPRYLLMLIPLLFTPLWYLVKVSPHDWRLKSIRRILMTFGFLMIVAVIYFYLFEIGEHVNGYNLKLIFSFLGVLVLLSWILYDQKQFFFKFMILIFLVRISFNLIVIPDKHIHKFDLICKEEAERIAEDYKDADLRILANSKVDYTSSFYITRIRQKALYRDFEKPDPKAYYFVDTMRIGLSGIEDLAVDEILIREHRRKIYLVKGKDAIHAIRK